MPKQSENKTISREAFQEWLDHGTGPLCLCANGNHHTFIKFPKTDQLEYLFEQTSYHSNGIGWEDRFQFLCIYDRRSHVLYLGEGESFPPVVEGLEPCDTVDIRSLRHALQDEVNRLVEERVGDDRNNLSATEITNPYEKRNLEHYQEYGSGNDAIKLFFEGKASSGIRFKSWYEIKGWTEDALLSYLEDPAAHTQAAVTRYIAENQEGFLKQFLENEALIARLQAIEADVDGPIQRMKAISNAVKASGAKTVTVTVQKDGQELSFKTEAQSLIGYQNYYSSWSIPAQDRRRFEEAFGRCADYHAEEITRITYGRNTLYEAAQPEMAQEQLEQSMTIGGM